MGFWDSVAALPLQKSEVKEEAKSTQGRQIIRKRFDDEKVATETILAIAEELIATEVVMKVTRELPLRGTSITGLEQHWESNRAGLRVIKREFASENISYVRIETSLTINDRELNLAAEYYSDGSSLIAQYPDGFSRSGVKFPVTDEATKRQITRRLLSRMSQLSSRLVSL